MDNRSLVSPLGVYVLPAPADNASRSILYADYIDEILSHAGLGYHTIELENLGGDLAGLQILLTVGEGELEENIKTKLTEWVASGGSWIAVAGTLGLENLLGVEIQPPSYEAWNCGIATMGEGYLEPTEASHPILEQLNIPLHFFNGIPVEAKAGKVLAKVMDAHQRQTPRAAIVENQVGQGGKSILLAPDLTGAVVRIQQGIAITRDGLAAPDGTAPICDGVLKSDDGMALDWIFDRQPLEGVEGYQAFLEPIADQWREILLRSIFYLAREKKINLPLLWLYPRNLPALGHLSHDTDGNIPELAERLLEVLLGLDIKTTWCQILDKYPAELAQKIYDHGYEFAYHYNSLDMEWSEAEFKRQCQKLSEGIPGERPISNKNHYLRWEGDTEFFDWCVGEGVQFDGTKGPSKTGCMGFVFGTCHPYFPVAPDGRIIDVVELPTLTQDLVITAPTELSKPLVDAAVKHHGIMHLLFHPAHIKTAGVEDALTRAVNYGKEQGMEFWTSRKINGWERARRKLVWNKYQQSDNVLELNISSGAALPEASLMILGEDRGTITIDGRECDVVTVERWGFKFQSVILDIEEKSELALRANL